MEGFSIVFALGVLSVSFGIYRIGDILQEILEELKKRNQELTKE